MSFWKWLGKKLKNGTKEFLAFGGWIILPMIAHGIYLAYIQAAAYVPTLFFWFIPMLLTAAYDYWKSFVRESEVEK